MKARPSGRAFSVMTEWFAYLLWSDSAERSYIGVSTEPERRLAQHNGERVGGARSTRAGRPWTIERLHGPFLSRSVAQRVEAAWKQQSGAARRVWAGLSSDELAD